jgi:hypothetical protein
MAELFTEDIFSFSEGTSHMSPFRLPVYYLTKAAKDPLSTKDVIGLEITHGRQEILDLY